MKYAFFFLLTSVCSLPVLVSAATISGNYQDTVCKKLYIGLYEQGLYQCVDSVVLDAEGRYTTTLPDDRRGMLLIACANDRPADRALNEADNTSSLLFVYDGQDIAYDTSWRWHSSPDYLRVKQGGESTELLQYLHHQRTELYEHLSALETVIDLTEDREGALFAALTEEYGKKLKSYNTTVQNVILVSEPGSLFHVSLENMLEPETPAFLRGEARIDWLREHFFDQAPLDNVLIYNTPFFTTRLRQYLYIWQPKGMASETDIANGKRRGIALLKDRLASADAASEALDEAVKKIMNDKQ